MFMEDKTVHVGCAMGCVEGQNILAVCHAVGVDVINADIQCTLQTIPITGAVMVAFSTHTAETYLAIFALGTVHVFQLKGSMCSTMQYIEITSIQVSSSSFLQNNMCFAYPCILTCIGDVTLLSNCATHASELIVGEGSRGVIDFCQLSFRGLAIAACYSNSGLIDVFEVFEDSKSTLRSTVSHFDDTGPGARPDSAVRVLWRPAASLVQQTFLSHDSSGLVKVWCVLFKYRTVQPSLTEDAIAFSEHLEYDETVCLAVLDRFVDLRNALFMSVSWLSHTPFHSSSSSSTSSTSSFTGLSYSAWLVVLQGPPSHSLAHVHIRSRHPSLRCEYELHSVGPSLHLPIDKTLLALAVSGRFGYLCEVPESLFIVAITEPHTDTNVSMTRGLQLASAALHIADGDDRHWVVSSRTSCSFSAPSLRGAIVQSNVFLGTASKFTQVSDGGKTVACMQGTSACVGSTLSATLMARSGVTTNLTLRELTFLTHPPLTFDTPILSALLCVEPDRVVCLRENGTGKTVSMHSVCESVWTESGLITLPQAVHISGTVGIKGDVYIATIETHLSSIRLCVYAFQPHSSELLRLLHVEDCGIDARAVQLWEPRRGNLRVCVLYRGGAVDVSILVLDEGVCRLQHSHPLLIVESPLLKVFGTNDARNWVFLSAPIVDEAAAMFMTNADDRRLLLVLLPTGGLGMVDSRFQVSCVDLLQLEASVGSLSVVGPLAAQLCCGNKWLLLRCTGSRWEVKLSVRRGAIDAPMCGPLREEQGHRGEDKDVSAQNFPHYIHAPFLLGTHLFSVRAEDGGSADVRALGSLLLVLDKLCSLYELSRSDDAPKRTFDVWVNELEEASRFIVSMGKGEVDLEDIGEKIALRQQLLSELCVCEEELVLLGVIATCVSKVFSGQELFQERESEEESPLHLPAQLEGLDSVGYNACMLYFATDTLEGLRYKSSADRPNAPMSGTAVASAFISRWQDRIFTALLGDSIDNEDAKTDSALRFSQIWWGRNHAGSFEEGEYDVLGSLSAGMVGMWAVDLAPFKDLIEKKSLAQFREKRDSMKIFLELIVLGKSSTLFQLSKTDRNIVGRQLQALLTNDFASSQGKKAAQKNAFALLRLQRYKHAAATFLCAEPPLLKEAARVLSKNMGDPFLALLVTRIVEGRQKEPFEYGFILGPESRRVLREYMLPLLIQGIRTRTGEAPPLPHVWGVDATMLGLVCGMWLQDGAIVKEVLDLSVSLGLFAEGGAPSLSKAVQHKFNVAGALEFLGAFPLCSKAHKQAMAVSLQTVLSVNGMGDSLALGLDTLSTPTTTELKQSSFFSACINAKRAWDASQNAIVVEETVIPQVVEAPARSTTGFNFASLGRAAPSILAKSVIPDSSFSALDNFDPPPRRTDYPKATVFDPLSDFDPPPQPIKPKAAVYDPLSDFDPPPQPIKPKAAVYDPLSDFDPPPQSIKPKAAVYDPLSDFDPPPQSRKSASELPRPS